MLQLTIFLERSQSWTKVMIPKPMLWKTADGGRGSKARSGKWKNMLIVSSHPIMALATRGSWPGSSGKSIYSRKAVLYYLYVWLCIEDAWYKHCCLNIWPRSLCCWWKYGFRSPWSGILASHLLEINICTLLENLNKFFLITQVADQESTWAGLKGRFQTVGERGWWSKLAGGVTETFQWLAARAHLQCSEHQCPIYWEVKVYAPFLYPLPMALLSRSLKFEREHEHFAAPMRQKCLVATNIEARDREHWGTAHMEGWELSLHLPGIKIFPTTYCTIEPGTSK